MDFETLKFELRSVDGSPDSLIRGVNVILENLNSDAPHYALPLERDFFELFIKTLLNMIVKGQQVQLTGLLKDLNKIVISDEDLAYPFIDLPPKKKFGAQLNYLCELLSIYIRTDLDAKDHLRFLSGSKVQYRLRELLVELFKANAAIYPSQLRSLYIYEYKKEAAKQQAIKRDLDLLTEMGLLRRTSVNSKTIYFELTPKAFHYKNEILILQQDIEEDDEIEQTIDHEHPDLNLKDSQLKASVPERASHLPREGGYQPSTGILNEIKNNGQIYPYRDELSARPEKEDISRQLEY